MSLYARFTARARPANQHAFFAGVFQNTVKMEDCDSDGISIHSSDRDGDCRDGASGGGGGPRLRESAKRIADRIDERIGADVAAPETVSGQQSET